MILLYLLYNTIYTYKIDINILYYMIERDCTFKYIYLYVRSIIELMVTICIAYFVVYVLQYMNKMGHKGIKLCNTIYICILSVQVIMNLKFNGLYFMNYMGKKNYFLKK